MNTHKFVIPPTVTVNRNQPSPNGESGANRETMRENRPVKMVFGVTSLGNLAGALALALFFMPTISAASDLGINASTVFRFEERTAPGFEKNTVAPATQFVNVNLGKMADGNLSFHLSGWGRVDLAEQSSHDGTVEGDIAYGYLMYHLPKGNGQLKAGRFFVYDVGPVEQLDGVSARVDLQRGFDVSGFAGKPVKMDHYQDNRGNIIAGGRLGYRYGGKLDLGISALHEDGAWTRQYSPGGAGLRTEQKYRQLVGADLWLSPVRFMELNGRTSFDTVVGEVAEHSYLLTLRPLKAFSVAAEFNEQQLESFFSASSLPITMFRPIPGTRVTSYGATASYTVARPVELTGDYKETRYRSAGYGTSKRYGFGARILLLEKIRLGLGWHRLDSQVAAINSYDELHGYGVYNSGIFFAAVDLIGYKFDQSIYGKDSAFEATVSAGCRVTPEVALSGDVTYGKNPLMNSETRGMFKMNYNYETKGTR